MKVRLFSSHSESCVEMESSHDFDTLEKDLASNGTSEYFTGDTTKLTLNQFKNMDSECKGHLNN